MSSTIIREKTLLDIDRRVKRVLRGLDYPEPPLTLEVVRELLNLDLMYYTSDDPGILRETVSRIRVSGIQILKRPGLLIDAIRKFDLKALYIPDQKRILIDKSQPKLKHRWNEAHEIGHSLLPWHEGAMLGDDQLTLLPSCHQQLEAEANYAAGRLLFLQEKFDQQAIDYNPSIESVKSLKPIFGNTYTTTFWRCIETWGLKIPIVGLITNQPSNGSCEHLIPSEAFAAQFSQVKERELVEIVDDYCEVRRGGPVGETDAVLCDDNGDKHIFYFESYSFYYQILTLGIHTRIKAAMAD